jgi:hypothetical protein
MRKKKYNQIGCIKPAPDRFRLKEFGGDMTIDQFRENLTIDVSESKETIETKPVVNTTVVVPNNTRKMNEIKNASSNNNALKMKRNKPLKRDSTNLESALGLIITPKS